MATARVAGSHAQQMSSGLTSAITLAYGGALTPGSLLDVTVALYNSPAVTVTVSDGTNGSYTQIGTYSVYGGGVQGNSSKWIFKNNGSSGTPTVTVTPSSSSYVTIALDEYTGMGTAPTVRHSVNTGFTSFVPTGTVTAVAGDLVLASCGLDNDLYDSCNAPFIFSGGIAFDGLNEGYASAYHLSAAGNEACTFTGGSGTQIGSYIIVSLTPSGGGGPTVGQISPAIRQQQIDGIIGRYDG